MFITVNINPSFKAKSCGKPYNDPLGSLYGLKKQKSAASGEQCWRTIYQGYQQQNAISNMAKKNAQMAQIIFGKQKLEITDNKKRRMINPIIFENKRKPYLKFD